MVSSATPRLCDRPNQHAREPGFSALTGGAVVHGYQEYVLTRNTVTPLPIDETLQRKHALVAPHLARRVVAGRTVLDIGANGGFFSFLAAQGGASRVHALDIDPAYQGILNDAAAHLGLTQVESLGVNVARWHEPADIVIALAIIHWIYSCTAVLGSLDAVIAHLAALSREYAIVEWVEPHDPAIAFFGHTSWNREFVLESYTLENFERALRKHFGTVTCVGSVSPTRRIYVAQRREHAVDRVTPLPQIADADRLISARMLIRLNDIEYWSLVYDLGDRVLKQASFNLAGREAEFLRRLDSPYFPALLDSGEGDGFSWLSMAKAPGRSLTNDDRLESEQALREFAGHAIAILAALQAAGISHNDIRPANFMLGHGRPMLLDFGWASAADLPLPGLPEGLGEEYRCTDGSLSDVYSMGKVLQTLSGGAAGRLEPVLQLMAAEGADARIGSPAILRTLLAVCGPLSSIQPAHAD